MSRQRLGAGMARVLIVDDELVVAETLRRVFEKNGFAACVVNSAAAALLEAKSFAPDLLLCDLDMPDKDGGKLILEMDDVVPGCPVLILTGSGEGEALLRRLSTQTSRRIDLLLKPCAPLELLRVAGRMVAA